MKMHTQYTARDRGRFVADPGDPVKVLYTPEHDTDGVLRLKVSGKENLYDYIQSFKDSTDIHVLLQQYKQGDEAALSRVQGAYGDFTSLPTTYAELLNRVIQGEQYFESLPVEIRAKFNHNFGEWISQVGSDSWFSKMDIPNPASAVVPDIPTPPIVTPVSPDPVPSVSASV